MNQTELVEQLLAMTEAIKQAASLADWPQAARLTEERVPLLMSLSADQQPGALDMIRRIQAIDAGLIADAHTFRTELESEYNAAMTRTKAAGAYQQVARL
ncbi:flagellar protein FliT [Paraburkholderia rhynchosiae]|uniref:Flagellar protein FliT n=1 Tax=Paraburkholderia rhynchosiae TaxID=487049 RepID=A0A2N7WGK7_9BURK|nr:flagellar protein FliT [Paraburkholderia rhynchosiae]PMS28606.1 flagellar protein FliT [Paraburkholderia rhynchosiae]CAB3713521.1 hypothetical protein LMG27174_04389 [Paraburkholderia rhynchosiae]